MALTDPRFATILGDDLARRGLEHEDQHIADEIARIRRDNGATPDRKSVV